MLSSFAYGGFSSGGFLMTQQSLTLSTFFSDLNACSAHTLVEKNIRLVLHQLKTCPYDINFSDALQEGVLGLMKAAQLYDPSRGAFSTYATYWIRRYLLAWWLKQGFACSISLSDAWLARKITYHEALDSPHEEMLHRLKISEEKYQQLLAAAQPACSLDMIDEDDEHSNRDTLEYHFIAHRQQTINACAQAQVENLLGVLDERERRIIVRRFGLHDEPEATRQELAREEHLTSERIRQIEQQALQKMRNAAQSA